MKKFITIKEWTKALRSGEYKQGQHFLHKDESFCCLGVAYDLLGATWEKLDTWPSPSYVVEVGKEEFELPNQLNFPVGFDILTLVTMNDRGKSFKEIADYIESKVTKKEKVTWLGP